MIVRVKVLGKIGDRGEAECRADGRDGKGLDSAAPLEEPKPDIEVRLCSRRRFSGTSFTSFGAFWSSLRSWSSGSDELSGPRGAQTSSFAMAQPTETAPRALCPDASSP